MTNFEYYIKSGRCDEGWDIFLKETKNKREYYRTLDLYNEWLLEEHKEPILDDTEKEYLTNVIKPFRNRVSSIAKVADTKFDSAFNVTSYYIDIQIDDGADFCFLPSFKPSTEMYKNMEVNRKYTLKELGL